MQNWRWVVPIGFAAMLVSQRPLPTDVQLKTAIEKYDRAVQTKDVATVKTLLAPDVLLYEHSVRNAGIEDVFENHLKPEIVEFEDLKLEFSDVRLESGRDFGLLTRQYSIQGKLRGQDINAKGNETMVWRKSLTDWDWKIVHIHYSHPCPRPSPAAK